jgi:predicted DCC family thiol-disulfide oxidoreductase YuxK
MPLPRLPANRTVEVFHDGDCPLCMREIRMLMRRDRHARIQFTNIAAPDFDAAAYGTTYADLMARIRGRLPDDTWIEGVEVFRHLYAAIGFRRLVAISRVPGVSHLLALAYHAFARNRLRLTGRCAPDAACAIGATRSSAASPAHRS